MILCRTPGPTTASGTTQQTHQIQKTNRIKTYLTRRCGAARVGLRARTDGKQTARADDEKNVFGNRKLQPNENLILRTRRMMPLDGNVQTLGQKRNEKETKNIELRKLCSNYKLWTDRMQSENNINFFEHAHTPRTPP